MPVYGCRFRPFGALALAWLLAGMFCLPQARAAVQVVVGPTPIPAGAARSAGDITLINEQLAFALAVGSAVPYGVPRAAIVDVAPVSGGRIARDRVVFADFIPNDWSAWPNTYRRVEILERGPEQAVVRCVRDWGAVTITTLYTLRSGSDRIEMQATMRNTGDAELRDLLSGFTLWPNSGFYLAVPGMAGVTRGAADAALADWSAAYDAQWMIALHAPYFTAVGDDSLDLYRRHSLAPGESRSFEAWLQVGASGDLAPVVQAEIARKQLRSGLIHGTVRTAGGQPLAQPVIVVEKLAHPYAWVLGHDGRYEIRLPVGEYTMYATAREYSQTEPLRVSVQADQVQALDFHGLQAPARVRFRVSDAATGRPLDARITISEGQQPLVEFLGRKTFFTELQPRGRLELPIAPGAYTFTVSAGGGFTGPSRQVQVRLVPGEIRDAHVELARWLDPAARGWYGADLHHHANQAEAITPPEFLARSQLAAGLDLLFVSDHDSLANLPLLQALARRRGVPFIPGIELSPSWGHFNAYPIDIAGKLAIDTSTASVDAVFGEARRLGASVLQVNHPLIPYGYFTSLASATAPGGFNPRFDLVELNSWNADTVEAVFRRMWDFWNGGHRYYLSGGTDTHGVWNTASGRLRTFAHVAPPLSADRYVAALRAGRAYVSYGPLIYPSVDFGDTVRARPGEAFQLAFELESVAGISRAELIADGQSAATRSFAQSPVHARVEFSLQAAQPGWYALIVADAQGRAAYTNPIWVDTIAFPTPAR